MQGLSLSTLLVVATLGLYPPSALAGTPDVIEAARKKLAQQDGIAAAALLEDALPGAGPSKDAVLILLQQAYDAAATQAQAAGRSKDAETYRENLRILKRKAKPAVTPALVSSTPEPPTIPPSAPSPSVDPGPQAPLSAPRAEPSIPIEPVGEPTPLPDGPPLPPIGSSSPELPKPSEIETPSPVSTPAVPPERGPEIPTKPEKEPASEPLLPIPGQVAPNELASADSAFEAKNWAEAGRIYASIADQRKLTDEELKRWLYCRAQGVAARINAQPRTDADWSAINDELTRMKRLSSNFYLTEYLQSLADERQAARKKSKPSKTLVVRGQAPEEPARVDRPVRTASNTTPAEATRPAPALTSSNGASGRLGTSVGRWQTLDSKNFRIFHTDPELAAKVARAAESARADLIKRWPAATPRSDWSPLCEIYLYPSARQYAQMTGQPEDSPGFSTMGMNAGRINARRISLRTDNPTAITAVLPHELTHVVVADFFTEKQIPRWADEGLAVLSEPQDEQDRRAIDLNEPLAVDKLFRIEDLMNMDYPDPQYFRLYYAQSVSVSRFLVEQGSSPQMLQFLQAAQREGYEGALRRVYKIDGYADLQDRWLLYAKAKADRRIAEAPPAPVEPGVKVR